MKKTILISIVIIVTSSCYGQTDTIIKVSPSKQTDTIFTYHDNVLCNVKEITPDAIKFTYPGEDLINAIFKNTVKKIVFKNGRIQIFTESAPFKKINGVDDFTDVSITLIENEIQGLYKLGELSSKAKGTTTLSNQESVKERAYKKLKIVSAMMGANVVYIINQRTEGNKMGTYYQAGSTAETNLTGIAYTTELPNFDEFNKIINNRKNFDVIRQVALWSSGFDFKSTELISDFNINSISNENELIIINGELSSVMSTFI